MPGQEGKQIQCYPDAYLMPAIANQANRGQTGRNYPIEFTW